MSGIYIHIPFCKQACFYCDFHFSTSLKHKDALIGALVSEIRQRHENWNKVVFTSIYLGGGTPSILPVSDIEMIFDHLKQHYTFAEQIEITLEANPDDLNLDKLKAYKQLGINRLSIGVQSFFDEDLQRLNRVHTAQQARRSLQAARYAGFDNITVDLIYGIPGLSDKRWLKNIQTLLDCNIPHLSAYALTVEPQTALAWQINKGFYPQVSDEQAARQFDLLRSKLKTHNYIHYEVSNFGQASYFSQHNTLYWKNIPYLGLGPAAHSYNGLCRRWNVANNIKYIKGVNTGKYFETEDLTLNDIYNETIMTGLRTMWGVDLRRIENLGAFYRDYLQKSAQVFIENGQLLQENNFLKAHPDSLFKIESVISELFIV